MLFWLRRNGRCPTVAACFDIRVGQMVPDTLKPNGRHADEVGWQIQLLPDEADSVNRLSGKNRIRRMVELRGIEPLTSSLRTRRSPN
jgi:hypothetical protein